MTFISQDALDYSNDAQMRVATDTRALQKRYTFALVSGTSEYALDASVVKVLSVLDSAGDPIRPFQTDDTLTLLSGGEISATNVSGYYMLEPGVIGFIPTPSQDDSVTIYYHARPTQLSSDASFELSGDAEALIERLVLAARMDDDGQIEWAAYQEGLYAQEASRLRRLRSDEQPSRLAVSR